MSQDKVTTATSPDPEATEGVSRTLGLSKEELRKQIEDLDIEFLHGVPVHLPAAAVNQILSLTDKYCETREVEARIDEIELDAATRAYDANLGASEFEAFITPTQSKRLATLRGTRKGI